MPQPLPISAYTKGLTLSGVPRNAQALAIARLMQEKMAFAAAQTRLLYVALNDQWAAQIEQQMHFFSPRLRIIRLPAWDVFPYDRASPHPFIVTERLEALALLAADTSSEPLLVITTVNALLQKLLPREIVKQAIYIIHKGGTLNRDAFGDWLQANGYRKVSKAVESGEFALRGNIIDIIPSGSDSGCRMDLFGDEVEAIRQFDPLTQLSAQGLAELKLLPASEILLDADHIAYFRERYRETFGAISHTDEFYEAIIAGNRVMGAEHLLPLFYPRLDTIVDYTRPTFTVFDEQAKEALEERQAMIQEYYEARLVTNKSAKTLGDTAYPALPPEAMYLLPDRLATLLGEIQHGWFSPFDQDSKSAAAFHMRGSLPIASQAADKQPIRQLLAVAAVQHSQGKQVVLACLSKGSRERLLQMITEQHASAVRVESWHEIAGVAHGTLALAVLPIESGFETAEVLIVSEQDLLGERVIRSKPKRKATETFMDEAAHFNEGELVVHREHGIGRFEKLETLTVSGASHDCLKLVYEEGDKLFIPVENIDVLTRYGADDESVKLDKLGSAHWQSRKAKLKERIKLAAAELMKTAAARLLKPGTILETGAEEFSQFNGRFGYMETEDQARSIEEVSEDLQSGKPMDRLICGDVGFGKTEVALRAAFIATHATPAMQVAVVVPTTLLARQHFQNFSNRFAGFNVTVKQLSRLVNAKEQKLVKQGLKEGTVDIVIGTHALLAKDIAFKRLGLVIVDEEQHFGVAQKEKLKALKSDVHVLTLSATPIPRTLQLALSGVRDLSLITTPPVDRLAVRSFVMPFDPVVLREALLREKNRGGGSFIVTPRIEDIGELKHKIAELVPELKLLSAHGQLTPSELDDIMTRFYEKQCDVLLSTAIIESGLDIPHANTIIINRADRFGLAQLYQLRGRVGRGKQRAYAYFLLPYGKTLTRQATRRLEVMQTLDRLGAGFTLASHDMDIRGFGNLVGEEQSGHIREVGVELYQQMLADAVEAARHSRMEPEQEDWSPQINLGMSVLIPESYISDLQLRMGLYKRIAGLATREEIDALAAEMIDRFGDLPEEVKSLFATVRIKQLCKQAAVERIDVGPKGMVIGFYQPAIGKPARLLQFLSRHPTRMKLRPDQSVLVHSNWPDEQEKITAIEAMLIELSAVVGSAY